MEQEYTKDAKYPLWRARVKDEMSQLILLILTRATKLRSSDGEGDYNGHIHSVATPCFGCAAEFQFQRPVYYPGTDTASLICAKCLCRYLDAPGIEFSPPVFFLTTWPGVAYFKHSVRISSRCQIPKSAALSLTLKWGLVVIQASCWHCLVPTPPCFQMNTIGVEKTCWGISHT